MEFLRKIARGEYSYALRVAKGREKHVMLFGSYTHTFCGRVLDAKPQINYEQLNDEVLDKVCAGCRLQIKSLLREIVP